MISTIATGHQNFGSPTNDDIREKRSFAFFRRTIFLDGPTRLLPYDSTDSNPGSFIIQNRMGRSEDAVLIALIITMTKATIELSQLTLTLIATASILLDRCLRYDLIQDRFRCQIWMWLAVALSLYQPSTTTTPNNDQEEQITLVFYSWIHLVVFSNIISIAVVATSDQIHKLQHYNSITTSFSLMPLGAWLAMISTFFPTKDKITFSMQVFCVSIAILWMIQWNSKRQRRLDQEAWQRQIPQHTTTTTQGRDISIDERVWYAWDVAQTLKWISDALSGTSAATSFATIDLEERDFVLKILAPQRISGDVLDSLTVNTLVHHLKVPYGPAFRLAQAISQRLVRVYPKPRSSSLTGASSVNEDTDFSLNPDATAKIESAQQNADWLTLHDQEYNNPNRQHQWQFSNFQGSNNGTDSTSQTAWKQNPLQQAASAPAEVPSLPPEQQERVEKIMKERYGLELPQFNTVDKNAKPAQDERIDNAIEDHALPGTGPLTQPPSLQNTTTIQSDSSVPFRLSRPIPQSTTGIAKYIQEPQEANPPASSVPSLDGISPALLQNMPPQIREIAQRRPDLVRGMIRDLQQQQQQQQQEQEQQQDLEVVEEEVQEMDQDDETTSLIQRRRRPKYESLGKGGGKPSFT